jgi:hypothetical protein
MALPARGLALGSSFERRQEDRGDRGPSGQGEDDGRPGLGGIGIEPGKALKIRQEVRTVRYTVENTT